MFYLQTEFLHDCVANVHRNLQGKSIFRYRDLAVVVVCVVSVCVLFAIRFYHYHVAFLNLLSLSKVAAGVSEEKNQVESVEKGNREM